MTNDQDVCDQLQAAASVEGEPVWQLPMFDIFDEKVKSKVADIKNGPAAKAVVADIKIVENEVPEVYAVYRKSAEASKSEQIISTCGSMNFRRRERKRAKDTQDIMIGNRACGSYGPSGQCPPGPRG